jgi:integrase
MSILTKKRTTQDYLEKLITIPKNTAENVRATINNFVKFVKEKHGTTSESICEELITIRKSKGDDEYEDSLYSLLQDWIDWNVSNGAGAYSIRMRFSIIRSYLYHLGVKTNPQDIKQLLKFPKRIKEERYPLKKQELRDLVLAQQRYPKRQVLYLGCSSSGMRMGEALKICKKDLDFSLERIMVRIKAEYTKTKTARTTFLSKECGEKLKTYLNKLSDDDLVFSNSKNQYRMRTEQMALSHAIEALGYNQKYTSNGFYKITSHSFRAYFFTAATRKHDENYAHKMTGHGGYLMQYDRMTDEDKLKMYLALEPDLLVFDQTKNELEIQQLKEDVESISELRAEVRTLRENQAKQDKKILDEMRNSGVLPN